MGELVLVSMLILFLVVWFLLGELSHRKCNARGSSDLPSGWKWQPCPLQAPKKDSQLGFIFPGPTALSGLWIRSWCIAIWTWCFISSIYDPMFCQGTCLIFLSCHWLAHCQVWFSSPFQSQEHMLSGLGHFHFSCQTLLPCGNCAPSLEIHLSPFLRAFCDSPLSLSQAQFCSFIGLLVSKELPALHSGSLQ